eukprot:306171_1
MATITWSLLIFIAFQTYMVYSRNVFNCGNATNCSIYCSSSTYDGYYCNYGVIYCPDYGKCQISAQSSTHLTHMTVYCGYLGSCDIKCDQCNSVDDVTIYADNSFEVLVSVKSSGYFRTLGLIYSNINVYGT